MGNYGNLVRAGGAYIELVLEKAAAMQGLRELEQRFVSFSRALSKLRFATNISGNIQVAFFRAANLGLKTAFSAGFYEAAFNKIAAGLGTAMRRVLSGEFFSYLSEQFRRAGRALVYGGLAATIVFTKLAGLITKSLRAFSQEEQLAGRFASVFRDLADEAQSFSEVLAKDVKQSVSEIKDEMATFQGVLLGAGFDPGQALELSSLLTEATQDLLAFDDSLQSPTEAMERMLGGLAGMVIPVQRFGADIRKANIDKELEKLQGAMEATSAHATQQERILARLNIMFEALGRAGAIGQARREAETLAASFRGLQGATRMMFVSLGRAISGYGQRAIQFFTLLAGAIQDVAAASPQVVQLFAAMAIALTAATGAMVAGGITLLLISGNLKLMGMAVAAAVVPLRVFGFAVEIVANGLSLLSRSVPAVLNAVSALAKGLWEIGSVGIQIWNTSRALNNRIYALASLIKGSVIAGISRLYLGLKMLVKIGYSLGADLVRSVYRLAAALLYLGKVTVVSSLIVMERLFRLLIFTVVGLTKSLILLSRALASTMVLSFAAVATAAGKAVGTITALLTSFAIVLKNVVVGLVQATASVVSALFGVVKSLFSVLAAFAPLLKSVISLSVQAVTSFVSLAATTAYFIATSFVSVASSIGLVAVAVLGLAAAFVIFKPQIDAAFASIFGAGGAVSRLFASMKEIGSSALAILSDGFATLVNDGRAAITGLSNAIQGGRLDTAFNIAWSFILLEFYKGYNAVAASWDAWRTYLYTVINDMWAGLSVLFSNGFIEIQTMVDVFRPIFVAAWTSMAAIIAPVWEKLMGWISGSVESTSSNFNALWDSGQSTVLQVIDLIKDAFSITVNFLIGTWESFLGILQKAHAVARSLVDDTVTYEAEARRIDEENAKRAASRDLALGDTILEREKERKRKSEEIAAAKAAKEAEIRRKQEERQKQIDEDANAAQLDADNKVANTNRDFKRALNEAQRAAEDAKNQPRGKGILPEWQQRLADIGKSLTGGEVAKAVVRANSAVFAGDAAMGLAAPSVEMDQLKELRLIRRLTERGNKKKPDFVYEGVSP